MWSSNLIKVTIIASSSCSSGFFFACEYFGRRYVVSLSFCAFYWKVEITLRTSIPLFRPGSVHSGSGAVEGVISAVTSPYFLCEPVWPSGKALGFEGPWFDPLWLSFLYKNCGSWTLSCDFAHTINETLKWFAQLPTLMQNHSGAGNVTSRC